MSCFAVSLRNLREIAGQERSPGHPPGVVRVQVRDLRELLFHFDRLDADARARHVAQMRREEFARGDPRRVEEGGVGRARTVIPSEPSSF